MRDPLTLLRRVLVGLVLVALAGVIVGVLAGLAGHSLAGLVGAPTPPTPPPPRASMGPPTPLETPSSPAPSTAGSTASTPSGTPTESSSPTPSASPTPTPGELTLTASPTSAAPGTRIDLTGTYPGAAANTTLQVQRRLDGSDWTDFPVTARTGGDGTFSTWVKTSRQGVNEFRVVDPATGASSAPVSVTIG